MSSPNKVTQPYRIREVDWQLETPLSYIRTQVFIMEQGVPSSMEWDGLDESALHLLAFDNQEPIGCTRILASGVIGRMAVLKEYRGKGVGRALLEHAIAICRERGWLEIRLSSQTHAVEFYQRAGFMVCSEEYPDAGIPHRDMRMSL